MNKVKSLQDKLEELRWLASDDSTFQGAENLGQQLLNEFPSDMYVLEACLRNIPVLSRQVFENFKSFRIDFDSIIGLPRIIAGLEEHYEEAWALSCGYLEKNPDAAARVLASFALHIPKYSRRAMSLLREKIPILPRDELKVFLVGRLVIGDCRQSKAMPVDDPEIHGAQVAAAQCLLRESALGLGGVPEIFLKMLRMPEVRAGAAELVFAGKAHVEYWPRVVEYVPEKRKEAWEFAFLKKRVKFKRWIEFVRWFETTSELTLEEWNHLWTVFERIKVSEDQIRRVAVSSTQFAVRATELLVTSKDLTRLMTVVARGKTTQAKELAGRALIELAPIESVLVQVISFVESLRKEATQKLNVLLSPEG